MTETSIFGVGDIVRVTGEDFDSIIMEQAGVNAVILAGWPNPRVHLSELKLVAKYDPAAAMQVQHDVVHRELLRRERQEVEAKARCLHCNGTGRAPTERMRIV